MKTIFSILLSLLLFSTTFAAVEDDSIVKELNKDQNVKDLKVDFKLKTFKSCADMQKVMSDYIKSYWKNNRNRFWWWIVPLYRGVDIVSDTAVEWKAMSKSDFISKSNVTDYSKTNTQVVWVDESDIVKTDGNYIYYYNSAKKYIYIIDAKNPKDLVIVKKLKLPSFFYNPVLYVDNNKLVILSSGYSNKVFKWYYINRRDKTYVVVFDIKDKSKIKLDKIYISDWRLSKSRKIGDYLYVVSTNYFDFPYYTFKNEDDIKITSNSILPKKLDISKISDIREANLKIKGKLLPYKVLAWNIAKCSDIEYILPDSETLKKYNFSPSYNIITTINLSDTSKPAKTKVIAWNTSNLYMSKSNLYLTQNIYTPYNFKCWINQRCIMPFYYWWTTNTLIHKLSIDKDNIDYKTSNIIPWRPLNQYSMDEKDNYFRIVTNSNRWNSSDNKSHSDLYILDKNLNLYSKLNNIWVWEDFQSSRFMWDKLFLVTFKQIDPLFVIDLKNQKNPKIIWELKISGYSRYLHPYDENHLIWLWYDTYQNKWGWTRNWGLKIDLYEINYDKKVNSTLNILPRKINCSWFSYDNCPSACVKNPCASACPPGAEICTMQCVQKCEAKKYNNTNTNKDYIEVKQLSSLVLWDAWSYTEALNNPRMFMWNKNKKLLLLPVTLYKNESKDSYKHIDFFQWLDAISIDKTNWIKEKYKISHINTSWMEEKRKKDCERYIKPQEETKCRKLLDWTEYCPPKTTSYVPEYCFADTSIWAYIASNSWKFRNEFIKRALWIDNNVFAISDEKITSHDIDNWKEEWEVSMK